MPPIDVVSDASVCLKWFHEEGEADVEASRALLDLHRERRLTVWVLDLTAYEIGNALLRGHPKLGPLAVGVVVGALADLCPRLAPSVEEMTRAAQIAKAHDLTLYDAAYAAVASARGATFATFDRALLGAGLGRRPGEIVASASRQG